MSVGILLLFSLVLTYFLIKRQLEQTEQSRRQIAASEGKLVTTIYSIGDAVLTTDTKSKITGMNRERLTDWDLSEAQGHLIQHVFHNINETTGYSANIPIEDAIRTREVQSLEKDTLLIS